MSFALVQLAGGTVLHWNDQASTLGRYERASNAIRARMETVLTAMRVALDISSPFAVAYDNAPSVSLTTGLVTTTAEDLTAMIAVRWADCARLGTASARTDAYRFSGALELSFFSALHLGDGLIREACDYLAEDLRALAVGEVSYGTPSIVDGTPDVGGTEGYFARTVRIPFSVDEDNSRLVHVAASTLPVEWQDAGDVCRDRFSTEIETALGLTVKYDNAPGETPSDETWIALDILQGESLLVERGSTTRTYRSPGFAQASIYVPLQYGDADGLEVADAIWDAFHAVHDRGVTFKVPAIVQSGRSGPYWRIVMRIPFATEAIQ